MTTTHEDVMLAILGLLQAVPDAEVDRGVEPPTTVPKGGHILLMDGDKGEPEEILGIGNGVLYTWFPQIEVEVRIQANAEDRDARLATLLAAIEAALTADRELGGLVDYMDWRPSDVDEERILGADPIEGRALTLLPEYDTASPLA